MRIKKLQRHRWKKLALTLGAVLTVGAPTIYSVACANVNNNENPNPPNPNNSGNGVPGDPNYFKDQMVKVSQVTRVWDANSTSDLDEMFDQMNSQMNLYFTPSTGYDVSNAFINSSPFQLAEYLLRLYNTNGGANFVFEMRYKGAISRVAKDFQTDFTQLVEGLDSPNDPLLPTTSVAQGSLATLVANLLTKMGLNGASEIVKLFGDYTEDIFDASIGTIGLDIIDGNDTTPGFRLTKILSLIAAMPTTAIQHISVLFTMFSDMSSIFKGMPLSQEWARDRNIVDDYNRFDHLLIKKILH